MPSETITGRTWNSLATLMLVLAVFVFACTGTREKQVPRLLDTDPAANETATTLDQHRKRQDIRVEARLRGCIQGWQLDDAERFPSERYYFADPMDEGEGGCPEGCSVGEAGRCYSSASPA